MWCCYIICDELEFGFSHNKSNFDYFIVSHEGVGNKKKKQPQVAINILYLYMWIVFCLSTQNNDNLLCLLFYSAYIKLFTFFFFFDQIFYFIPIIVFVSFFCIILCFTVQMMYQLNSKNKYFTLFTKCFLILLTFSSKDRDFMYAIPTKITAYK